jgi:MFS family permease
MHRVPYKWIVAAVFVIGLFMDLLDSTVVNVAIPTLAAEFDAGTTTVEWVVTAYLLSLAVFIPFSGWAGDRFGTKRIFMTALTLFTLGSVLCAAAQNIEMLIVFRVMQGIGGGMLTPVGTAMLFRAFPPEERAKASAVLVIPIAVSRALGPIVGATWSSTRSGGGSFSSMSRSAPSASPFRRCSCARSARRAQEHSTCRVS